MYRYMYVDRWHGLSSSGAMCQVNTRGELLDFDPKTGSKYLLGSGCFLCVVIAHWHMLCNAHCMIHDGSTCVLYWTCCN